jgi:hypothetical protein
MKPTNLIILNDFLFLVVLGFELRKVISHLSHSTSPLLMALYAESLPTLIREDLYDLKVGEDTLYKKQKNVNHRKNICLHKN